MHRVPSASSTQFTALQQHIDELTRDKMELQRGLAQQAKLAEALSDENGVLTERLNAQAAQVDALQRKVGSRAKEGHRAACSWQPVSASIA